MRELWPNDEFPSGERHGLPPELYRPLLAGPPPAPSAHDLTYLELSAYELPLTGLGLSVDAAALQAENAKLQEMLMDLRAREAMLKAELMEARDTMNTTIAAAPAAAEEGGAKKLMGKTNGDRVRLQVKKGDRPIYGWGMMKNGDVGVVKAVDPDRSDVTVDFDSQSGWTGSGKELVLTSSPVFIFSEISVGDLVRLNPEEEGSFEGDFPWPKSLGHQIGEVHSIDHDDGTIGVKFPLMDQPFCISSRYATKTTRKEAQEILARRVAEAEESVTDFGEEE